MAPEPRTYVSGGRVLGSPPLSVRASRFLESIYVFLGLYIVSFFSTDPYGAARDSSFNIHRSARTPSGNKSRWGLGFGGGSSGGSGGPGGGGPGGPGGSGPRRIGRVDDVRGPECKSCG